MGVIHAEFLAAAQWLPAGSVDMVLADLPYGTTQNPWDTVIPFVDLWGELRRLAKPSAAMVFFAAQPFATDLIASNRDDFRYDLVWHKNNATGFLNANRQPMRAHELILVFYRKAPTYSPRKTDGHAPAGRSRRGRLGSNYGHIATHTDWCGGTERHPRSVLSFDCVPNGGGKIHPTQKPVALLQWLVESYSQPGELVFDPTCGSGSTGVAAHQSGRRFLGIESDPTFAAAAQARVAGTPLTPSPVSVR